MSDDPMMVAVAAGVLSSGEAHRELLNSVAETARAIFSAKAASIFLYDERTDELGGCRFLRGHFRERCPPDVGADRAVRVRCELVH